MDSEHVALPENEEQRGYLSAIGLPGALWGKDDYPYKRRGAGVNYAPLQHLDSPAATDVTTSRINSCIRKFMAQNLPPAFVAKLCEVVGDLHENVWAHARTSGFSMAQRWQVPGTSGRDHYLEFALADCGPGFRGEMRRVGIAVRSHREAIEWCIQEEHSTKKSRPGTSWAQRMPEDVIGNPLLDVEQTYQSDDHHMGLGLFKLTLLIKEFRGRLWLATGDAALLMEPERENDYIQLTNAWEGVAIACRFRSREIERAGRDIKTTESMERIMQILGGRHD